MTKTKETKLMIIKNYIDFCVQDHAQKERMYELAALYVEEDHVDEIAQNFFLPHQMKSHEKQI